MSAKDLREALDGPKGSMDGYLEVCNEEEIRRDIRELTKPALTQGELEAMYRQQQKDQRAQFAAMAMQGFNANPHEQFVSASVEKIAQLSVSQADALITELAKP